MVGEHRTVGQGIHGGDVLSSGSALVSYFVANVVMLLAMVALDQITLVQDLITSTGYSTPEFLSGLYLIFFVLSTAFFGLTYRR